MDLQIFDRPLNLASAAISLLSIIYGISDVISFNHYNMTNENLTNSKYVEVPLSKFLWAIFSVIIDITFRSLCIAYLFFIFRFYMFLFPLFYFLLISFSICVFKKKCSISFVDDFIGSLYSLISSAYEDKENVNYSFRCFSKFVFNFLTLIIFIFLAIFYFQYTTENFEFNTNIIKDHFPNSTLCFDVCQFNSSISKDTEIIFESSNCDDLPIFMHNLLSVILWCLWIISSIEGILELFCKWMPYKKFYQKCAEIDDESASPNELETCL